LIVLDCNITFNIKRAWVWWRSFYFNTVTVMENSLSGRII